MVPALYNPPQDAESWAFFGALHMADHFQIAAQIFAKTQLSVPLLPLDPIPSARIELLAWFQDHQAMHTAMNAAMGVAGSDLSLVDFTNPEQTTFWIENNAAEHEQIAEAITRYRPPPPPRQQQQQQQPVVPQPLVPVQPQMGGVLSQGNVPILGQPQPNTQAQQQPNPALQSQPGPVPSSGQVFSGSVPGLPPVPGIPFG